MEDFDLVLNDSFVIRFTLIPMSRNKHTQVRVFTVTNVSHILNNDSARKRKTIAKLSDCFCFLYTRLYN